MPARASGCGPKSEEIEQRRLLENENGRTDHAPINREERSGGASGSSSILTRVSLVGRQPSAIHAMWGQPPFVSSSMTSFTQCSGNPLHSRTERKSAREKRSKRLGGVWDVQEQPGECRAGQMAIPSSRPAQNALSPAQQEEQQIAAKDRERAYNARFSSNLAYSSPPDPAAESNCPGWLPIPESQRAPC